MLITQLLTGHSVVTLLVSQYCCSCSFLVAVDDAAAADAAADAADVAANGAFTAAVIAAASISAYVQQCSAAVQIAGRMSQLPCCYGDHPVTMTAHTSAELTRLA